MRRKSKLTLYDCDRCKFTYRKINLRKQRGMYLCDACFDSVLEIEPFNARFLSPRASSTSVTAPNNPVIFTITTAGITALGQSQTQDVRDGVRNQYVMYVVGIPTTVTASTQIIAGQQGVYLTLAGTSDVNYVIIKAGNGTDLTSQMVLKNGNTLSLVYNTTSSLWCETSRS